LKIGLIVDSSCDLPRSSFEDDGIELMPTTLWIGDQTFEDIRNERQTIAFHTANMNNKSEVAVESIPFSCEQIEKLFLEKLVRRYDHVFCLTVTRSRSDIYENAMKASRGILDKYKQVRRDAGVGRYFRLAVINSGNIFTGTAVLAAEIIRMIKAGASPSLIDTRIHRANFMLGSMLDIKPILCGHKDKTGPVARMWRFGAAVETMFANATRSVEAGLLAPGICIGYGGDPAVVQDMPGFPRLKAAAANAGVAVHLAPMSITAGAFTGPGCVTVAFISDKHTFEKKV
jgi:fatty acid-binding protein DegV